MHWIVRLILALAVLATALCMSAPRIAPPLQITYHIKKGVQSHF